MKNTLRVSLAMLLCIAGASCGPSYEEPEVEESTATRPESKTDEHGFVEQQRYMPSTDPNLNANWDWTVSGSGHTVYYTDATGTIRSKLVQVPFYTSGHPLNTVEKDMYKADGWVLAFRDFGTSTAAPDVPFFALYNKYRGILRIMLYNSRELGFSQFNLELSFKSTSATGALLTYSAPTRAFLNDYDPSKVETFMVEANSINGWIFGDFMLTGYVPNLNTSTQLRLQLRGINTSNVTLNSTQFSLSEVLSDANPGSQSSNLGGELVAAANQGHKYYKSADKAAKSLREKANSGSGWWKSIVQSAVGTIAQPKALSVVAPIVGGLVGFVTSFIGGAADPAPREPLNFTGSLSMSGTITQSTPLYGFDLGLKYATGGNPPDYYRPINNITWGVFNLNSKPEVIFQGGSSLICPPTGSVADCYFQTNVSLKAPPSYSFNTSSGMQLVSVRYAYTFATRAPTPFSTSPTYTAYDYYWYGIADPLPTGLAVEVKMRSTTSTFYFDDDITFYKVYPFTQINQ